MSEMRIKDEKLARVLRGEEMFLIDGAIGSMLMQRGLLQAGMHGEDVVMAHPEAVIELHREYLAAGSDVCSTVTFTANDFNYPDGGDNPTVEEIFTAAIDCARKAGAPYVSANIGPLGQLMAPFGTLSEEEAYERFARQVRAACAAGADMIMIETMIDLVEAKCAARAAVEVGDVPVFALMSYTAVGKTMFGNSPADEVAAFAEIGVSGLGTNCGLTPQEIIPVARALKEASDALERPLPIVVQPNGGAPKADINDPSKIVYSISPEFFAEQMGEVADMGVTILGSCCGSSPEFTACLRRLIDSRK